MPITGEVTTVVPVISTCSFSVARVVERGATTVDDAHAAKSSGFSGWDFEDRKHLKNIDELTPCFSQL